MSLNGLCVSSCDGVDKVLTVVDRFVGVSTRDSPDVVVGFPLIRNNCCPRPDVLLDDGQYGDLGTIRDNHHESFR